VNRTLLSSAFIVLGLGVAASAQTAAQPSKVGVIDMEGALSATQEGQKAFTELQTRFEPRRKLLEKQRSDISALQDQRNRGGNTMSPEAKDAITRDIDQKTKVLNRDTEDAQADYQQETDKILAGLLQRMRVVIDKYARENGYSVILDVGAQQTPVVWITPSIDISNDVVALYDKNSPAAPATAAAAPAAKPPASSKPAVPPAKKP
jgi:outer membrane protein